MWVSNFRFLKAPDLVLSPVGVDLCTENEHNSPLCETVYRKVWWRNPVVLACESLT